MILLLLVKLLIGIALIFAMCYMCVLCWHGLKWLMGPKSPPEEKDND